MFRGAALHAGSSSVPASWSRRPGWVRAISSPPRCGRALRKCATVGGRHRLRRQGRARRGDGAGAFLRSDCDRRADGVGEGQCAAGAKVDAPAARSRAKSLRRLSDGRSCTLARHRLARGYRARGAVADRRPRLYEARAQYRVELADPDITGPPVPCETPHNAYYDAVALRATMLAWEARMAR